jgi:hypothetical protein
MFLRTRKKKPLSSSTSRMTLGLSCVEGAAAVVAPFD